MPVERFRILLRRWAPRAYNLLRLQTRRRRLLRRLLREQGQDSETPTIRSGPFADMKFVCAGTSSGELPMFLGCFEAELHEALEELLARGPRAVVNIGCAEGYYAVGIARRLPEAQVFAFDSDPAARQMCARIAGMNGVEGRVHLRAHAGHRELAALDLNNALLFSDCEGCEYSLLDVSRVPGLASCNMIIELHASDDPAQPQRLLSQFGNTHDIEMIPFTPDCAARERILSSIDSPHDRALVRAERTMSNQVWAVLRSRVGAVVRET